MKKSLGLIETQGLAAGIEAADAAVKSANVELIGYELTRGGGWTTVKVQGDVGAVKAAVDAARMAAAKVNRVVSTRVIPRPSAGLDMLVHNPDTVGDAQPPKGPDMPKPPTPPKHSDEVKEEDLTPALKEQEAEQPKEVQPAEQTAEQTKEAQLTEPEEQKAEVQPTEPEEQTEEAQPVPEQKDETAEQEENSEIKVSEENAPETETAEASAEDVPETDNVEVSAKNVPETDRAQESENSETEGETSQEQEPAASKPAKKAAASKGRKGGKRSSKQGTAE